MSFAKDVASKLAASVAAQAIFIALGGGGAVVTAVLAFLSDGSSLSLTLLGVSSAGLFLGAFGAYRSTHPSVPDEKLRELRREKIDRLRNAVEKWRRADRMEDEELWWDTTERVELMDLMRDSEEQEFMDAGPREEMGVAQRVLARLELEWDLV